MIHVKKLNWLQRLGTREVTGTISDVRYEMRAWGRKPVTCYTVTSDSGKQYRAALFGHRNEPAFGDLSAGDRVVMRTQRWETLLRDEQYERVQTPDGGTKLVRRETTWEPIVEYEKQKTRELPGMARLTGRAHALERETEKFHAAAVTLAESVRTPGQRIASGAYERMLADLEEAGYRVERRERAQILGIPLPDQVAVIYLSDPLQTKPPTEYRSADVLNDKPSKIALIDMANGASATLTKDE